jgi:hypothetical protein
MADEIKIRVGVQNNVEAGMANVVRDIKKQGKNMGEGWAEGFKNAAQGNVQGALTGIFGGFIAGAAMAGWQAGKKIDEFFGVSNKVAEWWTKGYDAAGQAMDVFYKKLRKNRMDAEEAAKQEAEGDQKRFEIQEKARMKRMNSQQRLDYATEGVRSATAATESNNISPEERKNRMVTLEQMKSDYQDALDDRNKDWAASLKSEYDATVAAEKAKQDAIKHTFEVEAEWRRMAATDSRNAMIQDIANAEKQAQANAGAIPGLAANAAAAAGAAGMAMDMLDPDKRAAAKDAAREKERLNFRLTQAVQRRARGITSAADDRLINANNALFKQNQAQQALEAAQAQQAKDIAAIRAMQEKLLTMK